jgi:hypothetical protein
LFEEWVNIRFDELDYSDDNPLFGNKGILDFVNVISNYAPSELGRNVNDIGFHIENQYDCRPELAEGQTTLIIHPAFDGLKLTG